MCVTLTPAAATFMKRMTRFGGGHAGSGFRLAVKPGGCSGYDSQFTIESAPGEGDSVIEQDGVRLFLTADSCTLLRGFTIDFVESRMDGSLQYSKPGAAKVCGCGEGNPTDKAKVVFMRPGSVCVKK